MSFGSNQYPDSIFWGKVFLKGINGVKQYYLTLGSIILLSEVPVAIISIIYQVVFFKIIKVKILKKCPKK